MSTDRQPSNAAPQASQNAQDLLARLYREIGISAVAAALQVPERKADGTQEQRRELPPMLRKDIAA